MILEKLTLTDFRVFEGRHTFDLTPRVKYGKKRPIILYGGLNGAGKTTTLTAVRLALYGRQSLGLGTSQKDYDDFLTKNIHRSKNALIQPNSACIELTFNYANMGIVNHYTVKRHWILNGKKVIEKLSIYENDEELKELNGEQCQGFLNELIPIGVSDLFFFDSEKIAELAEDTGGYALGEAIKKLLGLDLIDTLSADLTILLRNESRKSSTLETRKQIEKLEKDLENRESNAEKELKAYEMTRTSLSEVNKTLEKLENELSSRGGAWAATREEEIQKQANLSARKDQVSKEIREILDTAYPVSIAKQFVKSTLRQLLNESKQKKSDNTAEFISEHLDSLYLSLEKILDEDTLYNVNEIVEKEFKATIYPKQKTEILHDISDSKLSVIESSITDALDIFSPKLKKLQKELKQINKDIDMAGKNISRAPEHATIKPIMDKISSEQEKRALILANQKTYLDSHKRYIRESIEIVRKLDKLSDNFTNEDQKDRTLSLANSSKNLLSDFSKEMAKRKIKDLENEFIHSFGNLARKEDIKLRAEINPINFSVKLINQNGAEVDKNELSAGEKQIYAISILEALARTSGRKLPIIIDTPLARLDSIHRTKLIKNYFPYASHQVLILSTDTEVDEEFYRDLSPHISHVYKLNFDTESNSTTATEGYFWKQQDKAAS